ncbi:hypothetical protein RCL1_005447 [Eukaryota sp. TZLM3-RCL]
MFFFRRRRLQTPVTREESTFSSSDQPLSRGQDVQINMGTLSHVVNRQQSESSQPTQSWGNGPSPTIATDQTVPGLQNFPSRPFQDTQDTFIPRETPSLSSRSANVPAPLHQCTSTLPTGPTSAARSRVTSQSSQGNRSSHSFEGQQPFYPTPQIPSSRASQPCVSSEGPPTVVASCCNFTGQTTFNSFNITSIPINSSSSDSTDDSIFTEGIEPFCVGMTNRTFRVSSQGNPMITVPTYQSNFAKPPKFFPKISTLKISEICPNQNYQETFTDNCHPFISFQLQQPLSIIRFLMSFLIKNNNYPCLGSPKSVEKLFDFLVTFGNISTNFRSCVLDSIALNLSSLGIVFEIPKHNMVLNFLHNYLPNCKFSVKIFPRSSNCVYDLSLVENLELFVSPPINPISPIMSFLHDNNLSSVNGLTLSLKFPLSNTFKATSVLSHIKRFFILSGMVVNISEMVNLEVFHCTDLQSIVGLSVLSNLIDLSLSNLHLVEGLNENVKLLKLTINNLDLSSLGILFKNPNNFHYCSFLFENCQFPLTTEPWFLERIIVYKDFHPKSFIDFTKFPNLLELAIKSLSGFEIDELIKSPVFSNLTCLSLQNINFYPLIAILSSCPFLLQLILVDCQSFDYYSGVSVSFKYLRHLKLSKATNFFLQVSVFPRLISLEIENLPMRSLHFDRHNFPVLHYLSIDFSRECVESKDQFFDLNFSQLVYVREMSLSFCETKADIDFILPPKLKSLYYNGPFLSSHQSVLNLPCFRFLSGRLVADDMFIYDELEKFLISLVSLGKFVQVRTV